MDAASFKVLSSVSVGEGPRYVAVTPDESKAYVSNLWSNNITVVDLKNMTVITTIDAGLPEPREVAVTPDGKKAYAVYPGTWASLARYGPGSTVAAIDTEKDVVLRKIQVRLDPQSIAMDPAGSKVFVSNGSTSGRTPSDIYVIDVATDSFLRPIILRPAATYQPTAIDITPDGQELFVVCEGTGDLLAFDTSTGERIGKLHILPHGVKVGRDGTRVFVFAPQKLYMIDRSALRVSRSIDLSSIYGSQVWEQEAFRIVLNRAEDTAYLLGDNALVTVVDLNTWAVKVTIPFAGGVIHHSRGLALTPDETKLLVADYYSQTVAVIDTASCSVLTRVPVDNLPSEIKLSADGSRAYVLQQQGMTMLTVIDLGTLTAVRKLGFGQGSGGAYDFELSPDERYAYVAQYDPNLLMVYDLRTENNTNSIDVGLDPFNTVSSPDQRFVYVTNVSTDDVSVVDTTTNAIAKTIRLGQ